jgi:hypothetical protein
MAHILPGLVNAMLIAAGLAMLLAGPSILIVGRFLLGWLAAFLALILALVVGAVMAFEYVATHVTISAPHEYALAGVLTLGAISLAGLAGLRAAKPRPLFAATNAPRAIATSAPNHTVDTSFPDAVAALQVLGYSKREAASAVVTAAASLFFLGFIWFCLDLFARLRVRLKTVIREQFASVKGFRERRGS